ncbi:TonB-dependent receptor [Phenylobacterium sp. LjRoot225]|uniref:TonB-dependent receptor n=1 Tax=Phenylobacterium sp. LjRoot225 TaxID=3342285 RepID=UPI003ED0EB50
MRLRLLLLAATACVSAIPVAATAQDTQLGEIIVTARKRQESILNVPVIETAIGQVQLERRQTQDLKDIAKFVPGLSLAQGTGALGTQVSLRGVGTSAINAGIDASVSLNVDGMQITQSLAYASAMFDLGQAEVLKGPQALFYGKNSPGGVIALRTADPTDRFEVIARYGRELVAQEDRSELIISGPVTDTLRLRFAGMYDEAQGYFKNVAVAAPGAGALDPHNRRTPAERNYVLRGTAIWQPSGAFDARLKVNMADNRHTGNDAFQLVSCPDGVGAVGTNPPLLGGAENCRRDRNLSYVDLNPANFTGVKNNGVVFHSTHQEYGSLELNYRPIPGLTLTSSTGYYDMVFKSTSNASSSTFAGPAFASVLEPLSRRDLTQEFRANSDFTGPLNVSAGAYYQNGKLLNRVNLPGNSAYRIPVSIGHYEQFVQIESKSAFGQLRWQVSPKLEIAGGARWTGERRELTAKNLISGAAVLFPTRVPKIKSDNVSPELTVTYKPTDDITAFGSLKKGYKSGSFNLTALTTPNPDLSFGDEKVEGGEVGLKTRWLERRLAANLAFYDYRYTGLQVGAIQPIAAGGVPVNMTLNAGAAQVYGVDFDVSYLPPQVDGLTLHGAVNWNHARFKTLNNVPCWGGQTVAAGCTEVLNPLTGRFTAQNLAGQPLIRAPDWQADFGFDYEFSIGNEMKMVISNSNQYSSKYLAYLGLRPDFFQKSYIKSDLSVAVHGPDDRWEFALIGKNIGDKLTSHNCTAANIQNSIFGGQLTGGNDRGPAGVDETVCFMDRGREVWLRLTVRPFS